MSMSPPTTEIAYLPLIPGIDLDNESSDAGKIWQEALATIAAQDGYQRASWGTQEEAKDTLLLLIDWTSLSSHQHFTRSPTYPSFTKALGAILSGPATLFHVELSSPNPTTKTSSPITECLAFYFPSTVAESQQHGFQEDVATFTDILIQGNTGMKTYAGGWSIEEEAVEGKEGTKGKSRVFFAMMGWESIEAHMEMREMKLYKENRHLIADKAEAHEMRHVAFRGV